MEKPLYTFKPQDAIGKVGESRFAESFSELGPVKQAEKSHIDFVVKTPPPWTTKTKFEIKADAMSAETGNIFVEQMVMKNQPYPGGPWRALNSDAIYVHYAFYNDTFYCFDSEQLISFIERAGLHCIRGALNEDKSYVYGYLISVDRLDTLGKEILLHKRLYDKTRKTNSNP